MNFTSKGIKISGLFLLLPLSILFVSCAKEDSVKPTIVSVKVNGEFFEHPHALAGSPIVFEIMLSDDTELGQCKLLLSPLEGHVHTLEGEEPSLLDCPNVGEWEALRIQNLSGTNGEMIVELQCPDTVQGTWQFLVEVTDKSGNVSSTSLPLHVHNDFLPYIGVNTINAIPDEEGVVTFALSETLQFTGEAIDAEGAPLSAVYCSIKKSDEVLWEQSWSPGSWSFDLSQIEVPPFFETGAMEFKIHVTDSQQRVYWKTLDIIVVE